ncbi:hypothetical protein BGZ76_001320 [Entomortierella beljakovae]|nr:hypothetical protein BGZ76_001320 [Entomortierella beljakovae]
MEKLYDITIFGATGYTGKFIVAEILRTAPQTFQQQTLRVAIAGRSREKLERLVHSFIKTHGIGIGNGHGSGNGNGSGNHFNNIKIDIVIADVYNVRSIYSMCRVSKTLITCTGPFCTLGEITVAACIQEKCHYVDIASEPEFIERIVSKYYNQAKMAKVSIVPVCAFDCIPAEFGVLYAKQQLSKFHNAIPSTIEMYLRIHSPSNLGFTLHNTSYKSAILNLGMITTQSNEDKPEKLPLAPNVGPPLKLHVLPRWNQMVGAYTVPLTFADPMIVQMTQQLAIKDKDLAPYKTHPVQFAAYHCISDFKTVVAKVIGSIIFLLLGISEFGRSILLKHPKVFGMGFFSHEGPSQKQLEENTFTEYFHSKGFSKELRSKYPNLEDLRNVEPDVSVITTITGPETGYVTTPRIVVQSCYTLLLEKDVIPNGVLTPALAFKNTRLLDRLQEQGIHFSTVHKSLIY